jgi:hypothetical protein
MTMAIAMYFNPPSFNAAQYDAVDAALEEAGTRTPAARTVHVCFGDGDNLQIFDVWESQEAFDKFGETLMPILADKGIDPGEPIVASVHSIIFPPR